MANDRTIFDEPHYQSLEFLAAQALGEGNVATAFKLADRRCRIPPLPEPHCYLLRGEASFQMGDRQAAIADIARALEIAPDNIAANRRMLAWTDGPQQTQAALALIANERQLDALRKAVQVLRAAGQRHFANVTVLEDAIEGWAVWSDEAPLEISVSDGANTVSTMFEPDLFHPLADCGHAASFSVSRPDSENSQSVQLSIAGSVLYSVRTVGHAGRPAPRVHWPRPTNTLGRPVTVIVPVYGDYQATRLCLESLLHELHSSSHQAILVNDATPDPQIAKYLAELEAESRVEVLINASNLGFVGSVNRALEQVKRGDVILLNSDTIVPPGFIDRLAATARSSPDIGTITPLSNNGEFTSFPKPNTANPLGSYKDIEQLDKIAAKLNGGRIIDIPSGIGFCLYITRACLDQVGPLSGDFGSGYLEDADFCLRARARGFRNVCAPSVYVGHAGSKSFGQQKRALVVRNLSVLERRFPKHRAECAAFMAADPLRAAREAIEGVAAATANHPRLLVTGAGAVGAVAHERARELASKAQPVMILEVRHGVDGASVRIFDTAGGMPQSLRFNLSSSRECESLAEFTHKLRPSRIEILDPANMPFALVDLLLKLKAPYDIFIADAGLLGPHNAEHFAAAARSLATLKLEVVARQKAPAKTAAEPQGQDWVNRWQKIADGAQRILVPSPHAEAFAASILPQRTSEKIERCGRKQSRAKRRNRNVAPGQLGFVPVQSCAHEQSLISEIARRFARMRPDVSITIVGAPLDDTALMRSGNVFVTGAVNAEEFAHLVAALGVGSLFICTPRPLFGHPTLSAAQSSSLPTAYFDWSAGRIKPKTKDLPLDPHASLDDIIERLGRWISKP